MANEDVITASKHDIGNIKLKRSVEVLRIKGKGTYEMDR
jgi:hypothetical protein